LGTMNVARSLGVFEERAPNGLILREVN
jgi:hypothetical protein